ncbi:MFS transporter [Roseibium algae]|uniref:MFS transporter n=1 Tax=Roseibium algae TaxID=3123038 RepID=A0ABU8TQ56_9HYPH
MNQPAPASKLAITSWALFDWAGQPFFVLITAFVFAPYFASALADTPAEGQTLWGYATAASGLAIALLAPILGAIADATGHRKPWIFAFSIPFVIACCMLWYTSPENPSSIAIAVVSFAVATLAIEFATIFNNSMMPDLVAPNKVGRLSGAGWAAGYVGGLISLVIVLGFFTAKPETGLTLLGIDPWFGLDAATREGDRATGPFSALWYLIFVLPLFLFTPDAPKKSALGLAIKTGPSNLLKSLRNARKRKPMFVFLLANMIYKDGFVALAAFAGIYAAGQLGWSSIQIGSFGILVTITGIFGAIIGGSLDDRFGPKAVVFGALLILIVSCLGIISIDRTTIFFFIETTPAPAGSAPFSSLPEQMFLALGGLIGAAAGPMQASSRSLLIYLAPKKQISEFFGLLALSGKVTSFLAPLLVSLVTLASGSQSAGMSIILLFFILGAFLLTRIDNKS